MAVFSYQATTANCDHVAGVIAADSPRQARDLLRSQGLRLLLVEEQQAKKHHLGGWFVVWRKRNAAGVSRAIRDLATLLAVGIPLLDALDTLSKQTAGRLRRGLLLVRERVAGGSSLADSLRQQPDFFDELCCQMVEVGEVTGNLDAALEQVAQFQERSRSLKDRVLTSLLYPLLVLFFSFGVTIFLMTAVVPMLLENLLAAGRPLPWPTFLLKTGSDFLLAHGWWVVLLGVLIVVAIGVFARTARGLWTYHKLLLRLPVLGVMAQKQSLAHLASVVAAQMRSGIVFVKALELAASSAGNVVVRDSVQRAITAVQSGREIGDAFQGASGFSPLVVQILSVGQQSGRLEEMLERLAADYDRDVSVTATRLTTMLEPALILALAVVVGFILFATVLPILEAGRVLQ